MKLKMRQVSTETGFTLIEVMITIFLITVGVMAIAKMQVYALKADRIAYEQTEASMYAANRAEELINLAYNDDDLAEGDHPKDADERFMGPDGKYEVTWNVELATSEANTKVIQLNVAWTNDGKAKHMNFAYVKTASM